MVDFIFSLSSTPRNYHFNSHSVEESIVMIEECALAKTTLSNVHQQIPTLNDALQQIYPNFFHLTISVVNISAHVDVLQQIYPNIYHLKISAVNSTAHVDFAFCNLCTT